ncbi:MAG: metal-dependent hydrolase [Pseudomonadales bacterium]|nr:metal-dependent hydrolase [Pseudomonadales bacterium]
MDPITQGALGAALPQAMSCPKKLRTSAWLGCLAGMAADIDVLIRSPTDPLLFLEYHRQFTHSLIFIPMGALICSCLFYRWSRTTLNFQQTYLVCFLGYATHALLDACTTYGTQLFWPFSNTRIAWHNISVIDPLLSIPLLACVLSAIWLKNKWLARLGLLWLSSYLLFGMVQNNRAEDLGRLLAESRGHQAVTLSAKPSFGNIIVWKLIYEYDGNYYVDAISMGIQTRIYHGSAIKKLDIQHDLPWLDPASQQANDLDRFAWFSNNYLALDKNNPNQIIDIRYSILPNQINALWGIRLRPDASATEHVEYYSARETSPQQMNDFWRMLTGQ